MRTSPRRYKRLPIIIPVWAENNRQGRPLFMKTWLLKLHNTRDMQWTKAGISYFKYFQTFSVSPRWQHLFLFWDLFRGNFVAKITFMKVQQKRLERKQMKKHCGVNFPNFYTVLLWRNNSSGVWKCSLILLFLYNVNVSIRRSGWWLSTEVFPVWIETGQTEFHTVSRISLCDKIVLHPENEH